MLIDEIEEALGGYFPYTLATDLRFVLAFSFVVAAVATRIVMPQLIRKLEGAGITGVDINKPDPKPEIPEMGGLGWLLGLYSGVFAALLVLANGTDLTTLYLAALLTVTGAAMAGVLDDLIRLRQRFKAAISFIFAAPLVVFLSDYTVWFPLVGVVDLGLLYPLLLVPLAVACASQTMNMLEGFNGLSAGNGLLIAGGLAVVSLIYGRTDALLLLVPYVGATGVFLWYNKYPADVFPGDAFTLASGALLASAALVGKMEFVAGVMFVPYVLEFILKSFGAFEAETFATEVGPDGQLNHVGPVESLTHLFTRDFVVCDREERLVAALWLFQGVFVVTGVAVAVLTIPNAVPLLVATVLGLWVLVRAAVAKGEVAEAVES